MGYLSAQQAAKLLKRCSFPEKIIFDSLVGKAEYAIKIASSQRQSHVFWQVPVFYASVPAYNYITMQTTIAKHLEDQGFYVKLFPDGVTMWVSWKYACQKLERETESFLKKN